MSPSLFVARLKKDFSDLDFTVKSKNGMPVLYAGRERIDVELTPEELIGLAVAAEASDDAVIEMYYNVISKRVLEITRS